VASHLPRDYISGVVSEAVEEWCNGVERRLWELQYNLLSQLQQYQEETKAMIPESSGLVVMREELSRLRREKMGLSKRKGEKFKIPVIDIFYIYIKPVGVIFINQ
jgi:hypothetical protein